jgi:hypothetical protein
MAVEGESFGGFKYGQGERFEDMGGEEWSVSQRVHKWGTPWYLLCRPDSKGWPKERWVDEMNLERFYDRVE